tara:strand:- start:2742 stop:2918 length:177 start_codon:yes stop_codon:yes gene_type:complete
MTDKEKAAELAARTINRIDKARPFQDEDSMIERRRELERDFRDDMEEQRERSRNGYGW